MEAGLRRRPGHLRSDEEGDDLSLQRTKVHKQTQKEEPDGASSSLSSDLPNEGKLGNLGPRRLLFSCHF